MLKLKENDMFELGDKNYITLDSTSYKNDEYIFVNELDKNEAPTKKFIAFKVVGDKLVEEKDEKGSYIRRERYAGSVSRSFYVGEAITEEDIKAKFENGILRLTLPKKELNKIPETKRYIAIEG